MTAGRILVVSHGAEISVELRRALEYQNHEVTVAGQGVEILVSIALGGYDLLILDAATDPANAFSLCRDIRAKSDLGIIFLSGDDCGQIRIDALNAGADDFLPPGFVVDELLARVRAL